MLCEASTVPAWFGLVDARKHPFISHSSYDLNWYVY
jgi:hypothetical protein